MEDYYNDVLEDFQDGSGEYTEDYQEEIPEELEEDHEETLVEDSQDGISDETGPDVTDINERIDSLLEQIGYEKDYGTIGDYYIKEIGCYVYPNTAVFGRFVDAEAEGAGWTEASNGCYVPVEYIEDYESYISRYSAGDPVDENGEDGEDEEIQADPSVSLEDFNGLKDIMLGMADQDAVFYESVTAYMEADIQAREGLSFQLSVISCVIVVICLFLALMAGNRFADIFFNRMRLG